MPFREVVGHTRLIDLLSRSVAGGTLPPSLLFAGPAGIGKYLTALAVAQALNCTNTTKGSGLGAQGSVDACGKCAACSRIARGVHPDVLLVTPGDNGSIKIDQVRDIVDRSQYRPFEGRRRVVVIDEADTLVAPAQNALLKTLEEPTPSSVFILVTARPDMLLPTVLSRCPQLRFRPLSTEEMTTALVAQGRTAAEARAVAATADGSLGHALQVDAGELVESRELARKVLESAGAQHDPASRFALSRRLLQHALREIARLHELAGAGLQRLAQAAVRDRRHGTRFFFAVAARHQGGRDVVGRQRPEPQLRTARHDRRQQHVGPRGHQDED